MNYLIMTGMSEQTKDETTKNQQNFANPGFFLQPRIFLQQHPKAKNYPQNNHPTMAHS